MRSCFRNVRDWRWSAACAFVGFVFLLQPAPGTRHESSGVNTSHGIARAAGLRAARLCFLENWILADPRRLFGRNAGRKGEAASDAADFRWHIVRTGRVAGAQRMAAVKDKSTWLICTVTFFPGSMTARTRSRNRWKWRKQRSRTA